MITPVFRPLADDETPLLERATLGNLNWCGERFTVSDLHTTTDFAHYTAVDPARGDFGVVATVDGAPVGVVRAVLLPGGRGTASSTTRPPRSACGSTRPSGARGSGGG